MDITAFLARLYGVKPRRSPDGQTDEWAAFCPGHEDKKQRSLSVGCADGKILIHCHAGCAPPDIVRAMGLNMADLQNGNGNGKLHYAKTDAVTVAALAAHKQIDEARLHGWGLTETHDEKGPFVHVPYRAEDGGVEGIKQRKRWGLSGNSCSAWFGTGAVVPYGLWMLSQAREKKYLVIVEGESDCWTLWQADFPALGIPGAEMYGKIEAEHIRGFDEIFVVQETDKAGENFARRTEAHLKKLGFSGQVYRVDMAKIGYKDPSEWHKSGMEFKEKFAQALEDLRHPPRKKRQLKTLLSIAEKDYPEQSWAIDGVIPTGLTLFAGPGKMGKSMMCLQMAMAFAGVSTPEPITTSHGAGEVLYLALEDNDRRLKKRIFDIVKTISWSKEMAKIHTVTIGNQWPQGPEAAEAVLDVLAEHPEIKLVIVDTLARVRGQQDSRKQLYIADTETLTPWQKLALEQNVSVVIVHHTRKGDAEDAFDRVSGSTGLVGVCDAVLVLSRSRNQNQAKLAITGRDIEEKELAMEFTYPYWKILGDAKNVSENNATRRIQDALIGLQGRATPRQIWRALIASGMDIKEHTVMVACGRAFKRGELAYLGNGLYSLIDTINNNNNNV